jgi:outer membrane receptor protein involved in Fe transport
MRYWTTIALALLLCAVERARATATVPETNSPATTQPVPTRLATSEASTTEIAAPPAAPELHNLTTVPATSPAETAVEPLAPVPTSAPQRPSTRPSGAAQAPQEETLSKVLVTSDLDLYRDQVAPPLGSSTYTESLNQIEAIPGGENTSFQQVLVRAPDVVTDSFGQFHIRGEHANATYRIDGVLLPQPVNTFGQEIDTHMVQSVTLIDGSLPAQFGFHTAGIIDITSKSGAALHGGEVSLYGGQFNTFEPSAELGWSSGRWDFFVAGSTKQNSLGIENPTSSERPIHDDTDQQKLFVYGTYHIDDTSRLSMFVNASNANFQIPNVPNTPPAFVLGGDSTFDSASLNENQNEQEYYGVLSYQKSTEDYSVVASAFYRYGQIHFQPDPIGDLILQGVAGEVLNMYSTSGVQLDSSYNVARDHTVRAGLVADYTVERNDTNTNVFTVDPVTGAQSSTTPELIVDDTRNHAVEAGFYLQDEWKLTKNVTLNYGGRFDGFAANFDTETQFSPRVNLVWKVTGGTTAHVGYSRYFVPPPVQYVSPGTLAKFQGTTNAPANLQDDTPKVEKSDYYDIGVAQQITDACTVNLDGFYKNAHELVDLGQFGTPVIFTPFNYKYGRIYGVDIGATYKKDGLSAYANFAWLSATGKDIDSQQFTIGPDELSYIQSNFIALDHESIYTASAGASYDWKDNEVYLDWLFGSGLRTGFVNSMAEQSYFPVNVGYIHTFYPSRHNAVQLRFDVINLFDQVYQLRSGSGIGVAAPQYGQRRTFLVGLAYQF